MVLMSSRMCLVEVPGGLWRGGALGQVSRKPGCGSPRHGALAEGPGDAKRCP